MLNDSNSLIIKTNRLETEAYILESDVTAIFFFFVFADFLLIICLVLVRKLTSILAATS